MRKPLAASTAATSAVLAQPPANSGAADASVQNGGTTGGAAMSDLVVEAPGKGGEPHESTGHGADAVAMSLAAGSEREERGKKSLAYKHSEFHQMAEDAFGKAYERRMCCYCDAVFSFKGGTTSAALRHLKTAHGERLLYAGLALSSAAATGSTSTTVGSIPTAAAAMTRSGASRPVSGEFSAMLGAARSPRVSMKPADAGSDSATSASPSVALSSIATSGLSAVQPHGDATAVAGQEAEETEVNTVLVATPTKEHNSHAAAKRKRDDAVHEGEKGALTDAKSPKATPEPATQLTASQTAIRHFLDHHADEMPLPASRLRFAKFLTHNVAEAEMYNVLDAATRREYVRQFVLQNPPHGQV